MTTPVQTPYGEARFHVQGPPKPRTSEERVPNCPSLSRGTQTSDEPATLGTFNTTFPIIHHHQQRQQQHMINIQPPQDSHVTTSISEHGSHLHDFPTVRSQHSIASYLNHGDTNESAHLAAISSSTEAISEDDDDGSETCDTQDELEDDIDIDGVSPSLGYLDSAIQFLAGEKTKLTASHIGGQVTSHNSTGPSPSESVGALPSLGYLDSAIQFLAAEKTKLTDSHLYGGDTSYSSTAESTWHHTNQPRRKKRRKRRSPSVLSGTLDPADENLVGARIATLFPTPQASLDPPEVPSALDKDGHCPLRCEPASPTSEPHRSNVQHSLLSQSQQPLNIPASAHISIPRSLPRSAGPYVLRFSALAKKLRYNFPQNDSRLAQVLTGEITGKFLINSRGPDPGDGDSLTHVFIDYSQIIMGFLNCAKASLRDSSRKPHMSFAALALILERGRPISGRVLATSSMLYQSVDVAEHLGYRIHVHVRVPGLSGNSTNGTGNDHTEMNVDNLNSEVKARGPKADKTTHIGKADDISAVTSSNSTRFHPSQFLSPLPWPLRRSRVHPYTLLPCVSTTDSTSTSGIFPIVATNSASSVQSRYREHGVDELLQFKVHQVLVSPHADPPLPGATIVLATGDSPSGYLGDGRFLGLVRAALSKGWTVELWVWGGTLSGAWKKVADDEGGGKLQIWELDPYVDYLREEGGKACSNDQQQAGHLSDQLLPGAPFFDAAGGTTGSPRFSSPEKANVTIDFPGKTVHFTTSRRESPASSNLCVNNQILDSGATREKDQVRNHWQDSSPPRANDAEVSCSSNTQVATKAMIGVPIGLPGRTVNFTNKHSDSPSSRKKSTLSAKCTIDAIPDLSGRIKIVKGPLRAGGFCDIYKGELMNKRGIEPVAMKMLRVFNTEAHVVKAKKEFRREVSLWCLLRHPYVLPFYGTFEIDEFRLFMVSPWAEAGNSLEYLRGNPSVDRGRLLWQASSALDYLHSGKEAPQIVHGDLKADNVLISAAGDAMLCDFGLSRCVEEVMSKSGSSSAGHAGGTARFMAPELLLPPKGKASTSRPTTESDVFAFASLMLQIYTEKPPFCDLLEIQAILQVVNRKLPPRPIEKIILGRGLTDRIWTVMTDCWRFEASTRPSMREVMRRMGKQGSPTRPSMRDIMRRLSKLGRQEEKRHRGH